MTDSYCNDSINFSLLVFVRKVEAWGGVVVKALRY